MAKPRIPNFRVGKRECGARSIPFNAKRAILTEMSMEQRNCGMRIAVTEREAICFNAKRTKNGVHGNQAIAALNVFSI